MTAFKAMGLTLEGESYEGGMEPLWPWRHMETYGNHGDIKQVAHGTIMNHINKCIFVNITIYNNI